ncbi:MAG: CidA/LrgA family protein [Geminicoccaceae bacterium]|nr:CidA/LrgA family protein [Geminicoccaceae bacterium]MCX8101501.1 CidA/LrgA family protein [Geminicoccaceae bacterium]
MVHDLLILLACQLAGEFFVFFFDLPVPGPVLGFLLLFLICLLARRVPAGLETTAPVLLSHLSLLFVPAGVGVILHLSRIASEWPAILAALLLSTWLAVALTGLALARLLPERESAPR